MNLFRSEEHARSWPHFDPNYEPRPLAYYLELFGQERFRARARPDYISWRTAQ